MTWDGRKRLGKARDGSYVVSVEASDGVATAKAEVPFLLDATAPTVRGVRGASAGVGVGGGHAENPGQRRAAHGWAAASGTHRIPRIERLRTLLVTARDAAGNESVLRR